jgi:hypothetical protein
MAYGAILRHEAGSLFCRKPFWFSFESEKDYEAFLRQRQYFASEAPVTEDEWIREEAGRKNRF